MGNNISDADIISVITAFDLFWNDFEEIKPVPLIAPPETGLLFVNSGVAPILRRLQNEKEFKYKNIQPCIRTEDITEIDGTHAIFFHMLGLWMKPVNKTQWIKRLAEFYLSLGFNKDKLIATYFTGDIEAKDAWEASGIKTKEEASNWWELEGVAGGPDTELFYEGLEIGNSVFINDFVDFGAGLERIMMARTGRRLDTEVYKDAALALIDSGIKPGNKRHEYVLRQIVRRGVDAGVDFRDILPDEVERYETAKKRGMKKFNELVEKSPNERVKHIEFIKETYGFIPT